jgi:hypothetical protein
MKVIARIKGGLGNQLYCYAAAKRLAIKNNAELIIDDVSGFKRDYLYQRKYMLDCFKIPHRKATSNERLDPFERVKRGLRKKLQQRKIFENRNYIEQEFNEFDSRLLNLRISQDVYIDGLWQSEKYFSDAEKEIRSDLEMKLPLDQKNLSIIKKIKEKNSVALHIRWFEKNATNSNMNVQLKYYQIALDKMETLLTEPYYFIFSDNPEKAKASIKLPDGRFEFITHNNEEENAILDFWLMQQCDNFIIANSTFSWWAAWLSKNDKKVVFFPRLQHDKKNQWCWDYEGQMPNGWHSIIL